MEMQAEKFAATLKARRDWTSHSDDSGRVDPSLLQVQSSYTHALTTLTLPGPAAPLGEASMAKSAVDKRISSDDLHGCCSHQLATRLEIICFIQV